MNLSFTEEQELLRRAAREFLEAHSPPAVAREVEDRREAMSSLLWRSLAELGWLGLGLPEEVGGSGGGALEVALFAEELGRAIAPVPWIPSVVWSGALLAAFRSPPLDDLLRRIIAGSAIVVPALREHDLGYGPEQLRCRAERREDGWRLTGEKRFVVDGAAASHFVVLARDGAGRLTAFLVEAGGEGVTVTAHPTTAGDGLASVQLAEVRPLDVIGPVGNGWAAIQNAEQRATNALTAWMLGGTEKQLEAAVDYAKVRIQFGRPIGSFQAIQHKLAEVRWRLDALRLLTYKAASSLAAGRDAAIEVSEAKAYANRWISWSMHRIHEVFAGIGFMRVHDTQLYYRRLKVAESIWGDEQHHRREVVRGRLLQPPP
ncbi:MAG: acyl-CoA dehydrogenase family protein [Chloroflexota bacterium]|nr:acyl-CoA/acyl-ACP dehydrogenase [Dehalococcoidia bacterium]MDW8253871.1 acyl-CoA dehydrogenase family protein [Chloroflexota bacterium]